MCYSSICRFHVTGFFLKEILMNLANTVVEMGLVNKGEQVMMTSNTLIGMSGTTSLMKVHSIRQPILA